MATIEKTVEVIFAGIDQLSGTIGTVKGNLDMLDRGVQAVAAPLAKLADGVLVADAAIAGMAVTIGGLAVNEAGKFDTAFAEISTLIDATDTELEKFRGDILTYARDSTASLEDITGAIYSAISAGYKYTDAIEFLSAAEKLATAGKADLNATTLALAKTMAAYGAQVDETGRYSDALFTIVRDGVTTLPDLAANLGKVAPIAAAANIPIETLGAAMSALTLQAGDTATSSTLLAAVIKGIIDPTDQAKAAAIAMGKEAGVMGFELSASALSAKGLEGVMQEVQVVTGGNIDKMKELFTEQKAFRGALVLSADSAGVFAKALKDMADNTGAVEAAYAKMEKSFSNINQNLVNNIKVTLIQIGLKLLDDYKTAVEGVSAVGKAVGIAIDQGSFDDLFALVDDATDKIKEFLDDVAKALPEALADVDYAKLTASLKDIAGEFLSLFDGLDLTKPKDLQKAIQFVVDGIAGLISTTSGMVKQIKDFIVEAVVLVGKFSNLDSETQKVLGGWLAIGKLIGQVGTWIGLAAIAWAKIPDPGSGGTDWQKQYEDWANSLDKADLPNRATELGLVDQALEAIADWTWDATGFKALTDALFGISDAAETAERPIIDVNDAIWDMGRSSVDASDDVLDVSNAIWDMGRNASGASGTVLDINDAMWDMGRNTKDTAKELYEFTQRADGTWTNIKGVGDAAGTTSDQVAGMGNVFATAATDSDKLRLGIAQIKADFAATSLKLQVDLQIAKIQADADVLVALFDSVGQSVDSVTTGIAGLYGLLAGAQASGNIFLSNQLQQAIAQQQLLQMQLIQAQIRAADAQTQALLARAQAFASGQAVIQIDGTGLSPALQMVMWEIIEEVQVSVNNNAADFLLGI